MAPGRSFGPRIEGEESPDSTGQGVPAGDGREGRGETALTESATEIKPPRARERAEQG